MKIAPTSSSLPAPGQTITRRGRRISPGFALVICLGLLVWSFGVFLFAVWLNPGSRAYEIAANLGWDQQGRLRSALIHASANWLRAVGDAAEVPELRLDIKFKDYEKLRAKREEAVATGILIQGDSDYVPAVVHHDGRQVRVKLRLKGDWTDHLENDHWSFRLHVRGGDQLFGMRRFSIQHPKVRGYQGEFLYFDALRENGILAPRYFLVDVTINGGHIGLMAAEEHFSKELLESQGRKESVILKFDEDLLWRSRLGVDRRFMVPTKESFSHYTNSTVSLFRESRVDGSGVLSRDANVAVGLLRAFSESALPASKVFDPTLLGRFLAITEVWGVQHAVIWHNLRFYYNPITALLEPIGFDADTQNISPPGVRISDDQQIVADFLEDERVRAAYDAAVEEFARAVIDGPVVEQMRAVEEPTLRILHREFPLLSQFPVEQVAARARWLLEIGTRAVGWRSYPELLQSYLIEEDGQFFLEIVNSVPEAVAIGVIQWVAKGPRGAQPVPFEAVSPLAYPVQLAKTPIGTLPKRLRIRYRPPEGRGALSLEIRASLVGEDDVYVSTARPYRPLRESNPIPDPSLEQVLSQHRFLSWDESSARLRVIPGTWNVQASLILPSGVGLTVAPKTTLRFEPHAHLIARGPLDFAGTEQDPIVLEGRAGAGEPTWQGVAVLGSEDPSRWRAVTIRNTTGLTEQDWQLTGGVVFYQNDVDLENCRFIGNRAEDALNIVRSTFSLRGVEVIDTQSDGFDADFSNGEVRGGAFLRIGKAGGGDAIDVSGAKVVIDGTNFQEISDKAVSVGEGSHVTASRLVIERVGTGAASKDSSTLEISDSSIRGAQTAALLAYVKKPEYGPASIEATHVVGDAASELARVQTGSSIVLDGQPVEPEDLDVDALYQTSMKRGGLQ